jgi:hypothetical protein
MGPPPCAASTSETPLLQHHTTEDLNVEDRGRFGPVIRRAAAAGFLRITAIASQRKTYRAAREYSVAYADRRGGMASSVGAVPVRMPGGPATRVAGKNQNKSKEKSEIK